MLQPANFSTSHSGYITATGIAYVWEEPFAEGAERYVYKCSEIEIAEHQVESWYEPGARRLRYGLKLNPATEMMAKRVGLRLVAKEAKDLENLGLKFHEQFARLQQDAAGLAINFNRRVRGPAAWQISFLSIHIYNCKNYDYERGELWLLVEPELDGRFTKWNNNAGAVHVSSHNKNSSAAALGGILEEDEDEDKVAIEIDDIPQAFSHFSHHATGGKMLVCDLQGVWNSSDGFMLTDPVVHYNSRTGARHKNGATDQGQVGIDKFFSTHKCNRLCDRLGLFQPGIRARGGLTTC